MINMVPHNAKAICCFKAYGDLVIVRSSMRHLEGCDGAPFLVIGSHLVELNEVFGSEIKVIVISHGEGGVPAFFDVRKKGVFAALKSGWRLHALINEAIQSPCSPLLFDSVGAREGYLASSNKAVGLPDSPNIYLSYAIALGNKSLSALNGQCTKFVDGSVGIFPSSRIHRKTMPPNVISWLVNACYIRGLQCKVYVLDGESIHLPNLGDRVVVVPRTFQAMAMAVREVDAVLSADSMPAHLAEFYLKPVFVVSPSENLYWLPISSFLNNHWSLFSCSLFCELKLDKFLGKFFV